MVSSRDLGERYPQLFQLFGGYLNQDWADYGTADAAIDAFASEGPDERPAAAQEVSKLLRDQDDDALEQLLGELGTGYDYRADGFSARSWFERIAGRLRGMSPGD